MGGLANRLNDPNSFPDVKFTVEGKTIHAHQLILILNSKKFHTQFQSGFKESFQREEITIDIIDYSYKVFYAFLKYLYSGNLSLSSFHKLNDVIKLIRISNEHMNDHIKNMCETWILNVLVHLLGCNSFSRIGQL